VELAIMKKLLLYGTAAGALCVSFASQAQGWYYVPKGNVAVYGSYMDQRDGQVGTNPDGGGGGAQLGLNLTPHFFIGGSYQYDYISQSDAPGSAFGLGGGSVSYGEKVNQARAGGGLVFHLPATPVDVFGKVEYTHYDYQFVHLTSSSGGSIGNLDRVNDDGVGFHAGAQARLPGFSVYGSVGYLNLSKSEGPEFNVGMMLPLAPAMWGFVEYRYDDLHYSGYSDDNEISNVRAGVRLSF